jgi:hypothetical protein
MGKNDTKFFTVTSYGELATEYEKRINALTANGWDQSKFQVILSWYQSEQSRLTNATKTVATQPTSNFPKGNVFGGKFLNTLVATIGEAATEYQRMLTEITSQGWDQEKYQKLLDWYQEQVKIFSSPQTATTAISADSFPEGITKEMDVL